MGNWLLGDGYWYVKIIADGFFRRRIVVLEMMMALVLDRG